MSTPSIQSAPATVVGRELPLFSPPTDLSSEAFGSLLRLRSHRAKNAALLEVVRSPRSKDGGSFEGLPGLGYVMRCSGGPRYQIGGLERMMWTNNGGR